MERMTAGETPSPTMIKFFDQKGYITSSSNHRNEKAYRWFRPFTGSGREGHRYRFDPVTDTLE